MMLSHVKPIRSTGGREDGPVVIPSLPHWMPWHGGKKRKVLAKSKVPVAAVDLHLPTPLQDPFSVGPNLAK